MPRSGHKRLSEARNDYFNAREMRWSESTSHAYDLTIKALIRHVGDIYVENLRREHIEDFLASLRKPHGDPENLRPPLTAKSLNGYISRLRPFLRWMQERGMVRVNLMGDVRPMREQKKVRLWLATEEVWDLFDAARDPRDRLVLALAVHTGLRASELKTLRVGDYDPAALTLQVVVHKSRAEDLLVVSPALRVELDAWLVEYQRAVMLIQGRMICPTDYLIPVLTTRAFTSEWTVRNGRRERVRAPKGYRPDVPMGNLHRVVQQALASVGFPISGEGVHTLRRTSARLLFDQLVDERGYDSALRVVSAHLHHASSRTTEIYLGLTSEIRARDDFLRSGGVLQPRQLGAGVSSISSAAR